MEWTKANFLLTTDNQKIDVNQVYDLLKDTYWAKDRPKYIVEETVKNSLCFGIVKEQELVGFARVITDKVAFTWLLDVIIKDTYRGEGLGKWLMQCIMEHPDIIHTSIGLATKDAHGLYEQYGFKVEDMMIRRRKKYPEKNSIV
ncbi:GNAT family N-acetyltransferase [Radiobacillus sp. PE A8.2]|uniref:GNAT family N-acetyltransferase n=1 Tax=Radiobacillus sp. PE A8.2 TaxID=3380349 RepID=UPI00388D36D4